MRNVRILLLQARHADDPAKAEEVRSFAAHAGLAESRVVPHDLLSGPPSLARLRLHDALMVGGSGDFYVSKRNLPHYRALLELLLEVTAIGWPTFASCFGFQCLVDALGGEIVHDAAGTEVGTYDLTLTAAGRRDPLFGRLPGTFPAQLGRKDRAAGALDGIPTLAVSERSPVQALRIPSQPIWASQFHPELDRPTNLARYKGYLDGYAAVMRPGELQATLDRFRDSPNANALLRGFLRLVFG